MEGGERVRLFVALELPAAVRDALAEWRLRAAGEERWLRSVRAEDLHVTLCFLGWRIESEIPAILEACSVVGAGGVARLRLGKALWLPPRRPRVLAVELDDLDGRLAAVQAALSRALSAGGWYAPEARPFLAHVTVARVAKGARPPRGELPAPPALALDGSRVTLFRSRLGAGGARYEGLGVVELDAWSGRAPADPLSVVRRFHAAQAEAYERGTVDALAPLLGEDVVWHVPGHSRIAGEHRGRAAVLGYLALRREMTDATFRVTVHGLALIGDRVVQLAGGRASRDGRQVTWETVGVFRVRDGRISECWLVPFDQYEFDSIWA